MLHKFCQNTINYLDCKLHLTFFSFLQEGLKEASFEAQQFWQDVNSLNCVKLKNFNDAHS